MYQLEAALRCDGAETSAIVTYDPLFPGISFYGSPRTKIVTSEGDTISLEHIGISCYIPPGAVPEDENLQLTVRPCLTGPFVPPEGYELASPVYMITRSPAIDFLKDVTVYLYHFNSVESDDDCQEMSFLSTPSTPTHDKYICKVLQGGAFQKHQCYGSIMLHHFCGIMVGLPSRRARKNYSVRLYRKQPCTAALFCVVLDHPVYCNHLKRSLMENYPKFLEAPFSSRERVQFLDNTTTLNLPKDCGLKIVPDPTPPKIHEDQIDVPCKQLVDSYPQKILLTFHSHSGSNADVTCRIVLKVTGFHEEVYFNLLASTSDAEATCAAGDLPLPSSALDEEPEIHQFTRLSNGREEVNINSTIQSSWQTLVGLLELPTETVANIQAAPGYISGGPDFACREIIKQWLNGGSSNYRNPKTWRTVIAVMGEAGNARLGEKIESILSKQYTDSLLQNKEQTDKCYVMQSPD